MKELRSANLRSVSGGLFFVSATIFFMLSTMGITEFNINSLWVLALILPSIVFMFAFGVGFLNSVLFYTGVGMFLKINNYIDDSNVIQVIITLALMATGLIIVGSVGKVPPEVSVLSIKKKHVEDAEFKKKSTIVSSNTANFSKAITKGDVKSVLCTSAYDISDGVVKNDAEINISTKFGRLVFIVPDDCRVILNSSAVFGRVLNRTRINADSHKTLKINAKTTFGRILIRNK